MDAPPPIYISAWKLLMYVNVQSFAEHPRTLEQISIQFFIYMAFVTVQIVSRPFRGTQSLTPKRAAATWKNSVRKNKIK